MLMTSLLTMMVSQLNEAKNSEEFIEENMIRKYCGSAFTCMY